MIGIAAFKNHYSLWFFQGALLQRNTELLVNSNEVKTQAMRQLKLDENSEIDLNVLKKYIEETISNHDQGKKVILKTKKVGLSNELKHELENSLELNKAYCLLSSGKTEGIFNIC